MSHNDTAIARLIWVIITTPPAPVDASDRS
jgi:hypothetical protein